MTDNPNRYFDPNDEICPECRVQATWHYEGDALVLCCDPCDNILYWYEPDDTQDEDNDQ